jgi:hypothetical protein
MLGLCSHANAAGPPSSCAILATVASVSPAALFSASTRFVRNAPYPTGPYPQIIAAMNARVAWSGPVMASEQRAVTSTRLIGLGSTER